MRLFDARLISVAGLVLVTSLGIGCSGGSRDEKAAAGASQTAAPTGPPSAPAFNPAPTAESASPDPAAATGSAPDGAQEPTIADPGVIAKLREPRKGDLDGMIERRYIRALVVYSRTAYFIDRGVERGSAHDSLKNFEAAINKKYSSGNIRTTVVFLPTRREDVFKALEEGRGDIAMANLTVTPERQKVVDFSTPLVDSVKEVVLLGPGAPKLTSLDDLSGQAVHVRRSSSYFEHLEALNARLKASGKPPVTIVEADPNLEAEDLVEMTNAGLIKITVIDLHLASFWKQVFDDITVREDLAIASGGQNAIAMRKGMPKLKAELDAFVNANRVGTLMGNMILSRYLKNTKYVQNATSAEEMKKFQALVTLFQKYGKQYDFDYLFLTAQAYQESQLDQNRRSKVGAIGVMQVMPKTAAGHPVNIPDVSTPDRNIEAGTKLLRWIVDEYYKDEPMTRINKGIFAVASYNAGPGRISQLRRQAKAEGLDPNVWFGNVEQVVSREIGRETITYVSNIYKYFVAYKLAQQQMDERRKAAARGSASR